jgi:hypothetical protein
MTPKSLTLGLTEVSVHSFEGERNLCQINSTSDTRLSGSVTTELSRRPCRAEYTTLKRTSVQF